jgi:predicted DsbA family dithiol-disulfide isomerase
MNSTITIYSDLLDPFAHVIIHRLFTARDELGLADLVQFDHHAFALELFNGLGTRIGSDSEIPSLGALEPDAGWQLWNAPDWHYPTTVLAAFEAIHAAKAQSLELSARLDRALRHAFWGQSRCIGHHHVIIEVAGTVDGLDVAAVEQALRTGSSRTAVFNDFDHASTDAVAMSPHVFLPDGTNIANPGIAVHWQGDWARGFPVIDHYDPQMITALVLSAAG